MHWFGRWYERAIAAKIEVFNNPLHRRLTGDAVLKKLFGISLLLGTMAFGGAGSAMATPALEFSSGVISTQAGRDLTLGYEFNVTAPVTVIALAYYDYAGSPNHQVGLWNSNNQLIASDTVLASDALVGHFRYHAIAPVTLQAGADYVVGGLDLGGTFAYNVTGLATATGISFVQSRYSPNGSLLTLPTLNYQPETAGGYFGGSIGIAPVPEPETYAVMMAGLGLLGVLARRRKSK